MKWKLFQNVYSFKEECVEVTPFSVSKPSPAIKKMKSKF